LVTGQERHGQPKEKRDHRHERNGADSGTLRVPEKARGFKRRAAAAHVVDRFRERVDDEPKHSADFSEETAAFLADFLHHDDRIGLDWSARICLAVFFGHVNGEVASVR
jgi:hypothetical protein